MNKSNIHIMVSIRVEHRVPKRSVGSETEMDYKARLQIAMSINQAKDPKLILY